MVILESTQLPIDLDSVAKRSTNGKLVMNLGYFLKVNEKWLQW
jgi:hypothetical protein